MKYKSPSEFELDFVLLDQNLIVYGKFLHACRPGHIDNIKIHSKLATQSLIPKTHSSPATQSLIPMHL